MGKVISALIHETREVEVVDLHNDSPSIERPFHGRLALCVFRFREIKSCKDRCSHHIQCIEGEVLPGASTKFP